MTYQLKVLKDNPLAFWPLDESSGNIAYDISGCGNDALYTGTISQKPFPLVSGGQKSTLIDSSRNISFNGDQLKNYSGQDGLGGFGTKYFSDNDFSIELWFYPESVSSEIVLFKNADSNIKLRYTDNTLYFSVGQESIFYTVPYANQCMHVVATYDQNSISIYINGFKAASSVLGNFVFQGESLGTCFFGVVQGNDKILIDAPAIYRYALSPSQISDHYKSSISILPNQVVYPDGGVLFGGSDKNIKRIYTYQYPINETWEKFQNTNLSYNRAMNSLEFVSTDSIEQSTSIQDIIYIPNTVGIMSSKIEWFGDSGITVEYSIDDALWTPCTNGMPILGFSAGSFENSIILLRVTFTGSPTVLPKLYSLKLSFFAEKIMYAENSGDSIQSLNGDFSAGGSIYPVLSRNGMAGIKTDTPLIINKDHITESIEMIFRRSLNDQGTVLLHNGDSQDNQTLFWNSSGVITRAGIKNLYINGQDCTSVSDIDSVIDKGDIAHIVIDLDDNIDNIYINGSSLSVTGRENGSGNSYSNIAIYPYNLGQTLASSHFDMYTSKDYSIAEGTSFNMTEFGVTTYNNDWIVIKSV